MLVSRYVVSEAVVYQAMRRGNTVDILGVGDARLRAQVEGRPLWHPQLRYDDVRDDAVVDVNCLRPV